MRVLQPLHPAGRFREVWRSYAATALGLPINTRLLAIRKCEVSYSGSDGSPTLASSTWHRFSQSLGPAERQSCRQTCSRPQLRLAWGSRKAVPRWRSECAPTAVAAGHGRLPASSTSAVTPSGASGSSGVTRFAGFRVADQGETHQQLKDSFCECEIASLRNPAFLVK
jgi:hypothetical protein